MKKNNSPKKVAKQLIFDPALRLCIPTDVKDIHQTAREMAVEKLRTWTKEEIIDWVMGNEVDFGDCCEPYNEEYDED